MLILLAVDVETIPDPVQTLQLKILSKIKELKKDHKSSRKWFSIRDRRLTRNNIIVYGIDKETGKSDDSLRNTVCVSIFSHILGVQTDSVERVHRLGRNLGTKP